LFGFAQMLNQLLIRKYPKEDYNILAYFPDFLPYDFTAETYKNYLKCIFNPVNKHHPLMVDGFVLKRVSKIRYYWESFKGFFGFNNHCDSNRVKLQSLKLLYWGYLKGYFLNQDTCNLLGDISLDHDIREKVTDSVNEQSSGFLQDCLLRSFVITANIDLQKYLLRNNMPDIAHYRFGEIYLKFRELRELVEIDSANVGIQTDLIIHPQFLSLCQNFPEQFRRKYALKLAAWVSETNKISQQSFNYQINGEDKLRCAFALDSSIAKQYPDRYIDLFLKDQLFTDAWKIVESLDNRQKAFTIVAEKFNSDWCYQFAPSNTPFSLLLARSLMEINKNNIKKAIKLSPGEIIREYPDLALPILVKNKKWQEVYVAIEAISKDNLEKAVHLLSQHFNTPELLKMIRNNSPLVNAFAQYWVDQSKGNRFTSLFTSSSYTEKCLKYALILNNDMDIREAKLYFDAYYRQKKWDKAYRLVFGKSVDIPQNQILALAKQFSQLGEERYNEGLVARNQDQFDVAEGHYQQSFIYKMCAYNLDHCTKNNENRVIHERLLVQCKFDRACYEKAINLNTIRDLLLRLEASHASLPSQSVDEGYIPAKFNILYKKMSLLRESLAQEKPQMFESMDANKIKSLYNFDSNVVSELIQTIQALLLLSENMDPPVNGAKLGYLYFLLAEVMELQNNLGQFTKAIQDNYYLAAQKVPNNLYFVKKVFETSECSSERETRYQQLSRQLLSDWGYDNEKYSLWCKERWLKPEFRSQDIIQPEDLVIRPFLTDIKSRGLSSH